MGGQTGKTGRFFHKAVEKSASCGALGIGGHPRDAQRQHILIHLEHAVVMGVAAILFRREHADLHKAAGGDSAVGGEVVAEHAGFLFLNFFRRNEFGGGFAGDLAEGFVVDDHTRHFVDVDFGGAARRRRSRR